MVLSVHYDYKEQLCFFGSNYFKVEQTMLNGIACMLSRYTALYKDSSLGSTGTGRPLLVSDAGQMTEGSAGRPPPPTRFLQLVCFLSLLLLFILRIVAID
jgi:hypothetical protein